MRRWLNGLWLLTLALLLSPAVQAHEMSMAEIQLREVSRGEFIWLWTATNERAPGQELTPALPQARQAVLYAIGNLAAYWSIARIAAIFG